MKGGKRAHGQARADEQHHRKCDLDHDQHVTAAAAVGPAPVLRAALSASVTSGLDVCSAGARPKRTPVRRDSPSVNRSTGAFRAMRAFVGDVELGHHRDDQPDRTKGKQHTAGAADERQQDVLRQQLPHQPAAACPHRDPDGDLACPRRAPCQLEVGHVGARDQKQEPDGTEEQAQTRPHIATRDRHIEIVPQSRREPLGRERRWFSRCQALVEGGELCLGDIRGDPGCQPDDGIDPLQVRTGRGQRQPEAIVAIPAKTRRHHADDSVRNAVQPQRAADGVGISLEQAKP